MVTMLEQRCNCWNNVSAMYAFNPQNLSNDAIVQQNRSDSHDYMEEIKLKSRESPHELLLYVRVPFINHLRPRIGIKQPSCVVKCWRHSSAELKITEVSRLKSNGSIQCSFLISFSDSFPF